MATPKTKTASELILASRTKPDDVVVFYVTFPDLPHAESICAILLEEGLIACANLGAPHVSMYSWQGQARRESEIPALLKTTYQKQQALIARIEGLHPYETPCILFWAAEGGSIPFLRWIQGQV